MSVKDSACYLGSKGLENEDNVELSSCWGWKFASERCRSPCHDYRGDKTLIPGSMAVDRLNSVAQVSSRTFVLKRMASAA